MSASPSDLPPRWARIADIVFLLLVATALVVAASGGFRARIFGLRLAVTSPVRLLLWALGVTAIRHLVSPQAPIYRDLPARIWTAWRTPSVRTSVAAFVGTRVAVLFVGYLAVFLIGYNQGRAPWRVVENEFANLQARWDTGWYLGIAIDGYRYSPSSPEVQQNVVFFPALPLLIRAAGRLFGGTSIAYLMGGTAVVLVTFFGGLIYLFRLARELLGDDELAGRTVWLLAAYPFALFYSAVYTESLYLLGAVATFYHFRRREWWAAGAWGLLVGLTRPNGCFLSVPLALLAIAPWLPTANRQLPARLTGGERADVRSIARAVPALLAAAMPGIAVLLYSAYMWQLTGDPLTWAEGHVAWGRSYQGLSIVVTDRFRYLSEAGLYGYTSNVPEDVLQALGVIFVLAAVWPVARRFGVAYALFILVNILPPMAAGQLLSAGRFSSVLFPAFVWFAAAIPARQWPGWVASFMAIQALNAALFYTWRPMF